MNLIISFYYIINNSQNHINLLYTWNVNFLIVDNWNQIYRISIVYNTSVISLYNAA